MTFHPKRPYRSRIIVPCTFLFCVKTNSLPDVFVARRTPYIERKFESDDEDPLIEFMRSTAQGMGACHFVDVGLAIVVWRVVFVEGLHPGLMRKRNGCISEFIYIDNFDPDRESHHVVGSVGNYKVSTLLLQSRSLRN